MTQKPVGVIILNWNGKEMMQRFLPSIINHTPSEIADIIVADNGSDDGSAAMLKEQFSMVRVLEFGENLGFAEGYNRAISETGYKYTVLLNSDVEVKSDWLIPLYSFMESTPRAGACQPKILSQKEPEMFEYAGAAGGYLDKWGYPYCRGRIMQRIEKDSGQYDDTTRVFWASGAALTVRTEAYLKAGGLDKTFFAHMEEIDLCWRMQLEGYEIYAVGSAAVYHVGGGSLPADDPKKTYLNFRNNLLMLHKNLPPLIRSRRLFIRRLIDTAAFMKYLLTFDAANAKAVVKAHRDFSKMRKTAACQSEDVPDMLRSYPNAGKSIFFM